MPIDISTPDGSSFSFPDGTSHETIQGALDQHFGHATDGSAKTSAKPRAPDTGFGGAIVGGTIIGSALDKAARAGVAAAGLGKGDTFSERYANLGETKKASDEQYAEDHPALSTAGNIVGTAAEMLPLGMTSLGQRAFGLVGKNLASRMAQSTAGGAVIGGTDAWAHDLDPLTGALIGAGIGAAFPGAGAIGSAAWRGLKGAAQPLYEAGRAARADKIVADAAGAGTTAPHASPVAGAEPTYAGSVFDPAHTDPAMRQGNAGLSQLERDLRNRPEVNPDFVQRDAANAGARDTAYGDVKGDASTIQANEAAREAARQQNYAAAFANKTDANVRGSVQVLDNILASPAGQRDVVARALNSVRDKLELDNPLEDRIARALSEFKNPGTIGAQRAAVYQQAKNVLRQTLKGTMDEVALKRNLQQIANTQSVVGPVDRALAIIKEGPKRLQTDPELLYGIRRDIADKIRTRDPQFQGAGPQLLDVQDALDRAIEKGAPGYKAYMQQYADMSNPINAQEFLQKQNVTDATTGKITLQKVDNLIKRIENGRNAVGINDAKSISAADLQKIYDLRHDLRMEATAGLGKARGSNTVQNAISGGLLEQLIRRKAADSIAGGGLGAVTDLMSGGHGITGGIFGALAGRALGGAANRRFAKADVDILRKVADRMINPSVGAGAVQRAALASSPRPLSLGSRIVNPLLVGTGINTAVTAGK